MADAKEWLTVNEAARRFGVADRTFRRWVERGLPVETKSSRQRAVDWHAALAWYVKDQIAAAVAQGNAGERTAPATPELVETQDTHPDETINQAYLRRTKADADLKEHELGVRRRNYVQVSIVEKTIADLATRIRAKLIAVPGKLAPELEGMEKAEMQERLDIEMTHILNELKDRPE